MCPQQSLKAGGNGWNLIACVTVSSFVLFFCTIRSGSDCANSILTVFDPFHNKASVQFCN